MIKTTNSIVVRRSPEQVFRYVSDPTKWNWHKMRFERVGSEPLGVGSRFIHRQTVFGALAITEFEVTVFDPPKRIAGKFRSGQPYLRTTQQFDLMTESFVGAETRLTETVDITYVGWLLPIALPLNWISMKFGVKRELRKIRDYLESQPVMAGEDFDARQAVNPGQTQRTSLK